MVGDMNKPRIRRVAVIVGTTALFGGAVAGCGSSSTTNSTNNLAAASSTAAPSSSSGSRTGGGPGFDATTLRTLATKLGVSTSALQRAMQSARPTGTPGQQGSSGSGANMMAASLARALDLPEAKVTAALAAVMPQGGAPPQQQGTSSSSATPGSTT
jgi:hypothetical protein